jgi:hypothetical protein
MIIIDGRNPNAIPTRLTEDQFNALSPERVKTYLEYQTDTSIKIYKINGLYVGSTYKQKSLILCCQYKTMKGINNWLNRTFGPIDEIR